jgi:hypothetical protein
MDNSKKGKPASVLVSVKPEYIIAATPPAYPGHRLELYRNSDISPNGSLYIETPYRPGEILRQPTLMYSDPAKFTLLLRKTDASGHALSPATLDNTSFYHNSVRDYAEARKLMAEFEDHAESIRCAHEDEALQAKFWNSSAQQQRALMDIDERIAAHNRQFAANPDDQEPEPKRPSPPRAPRR